MQVEIVTKIEAASRQLREAILLFFEERDAIAIHTIVASAHQILSDVGKRKGVQSAVKNAAPRRDDEVKSFLMSVNYPYNFFKHADRDPDASINVGPLLQLTAEFIMDGVVMLQLLAGKIPIEAKAFWAWFVSVHHDQFDDLPKDGEISKLQVLEVGKWPFPEIVAFVKFSKIASDAGP